MVTFTIKRVAYPSDDEDYIVYLDGIHCGYFDSFRAAMMFVCLRKQAAFPKSMSFNIHYEG
jgi:hypothetical protein